jgi:hypothetical protein
MIIYLVRKTKLVVPRFAYQLKSGRFQERRDLHLRKFHLGLGLDL